MATNCAKYCVFFLSIAIAVSSENTNDTCCGQKASWTVYMGYAADSIFKAKSSSVTCRDADGTCGQKEALTHYLQTADEMINKAKINFPCCGNCTTSQQYIEDCSDLLNMDHKGSGVYTILPRKRLIENETFDVFCDMETDGGGWTVIQRRGEFDYPNDYFSKDWKSYKEGFGDLEKEFWLGNENIFSLTNQEEYYSIRFHLVDIENNTRYAQYDSFWIDGEHSKYTLHLSNYSGDAGDSMEFSNLQKFSTKDQDNDIDEERHCADIYRGGWWFKYCYQAHLNGEKGERNGIVWVHWKGLHESLAGTEIKIRPRCLNS